MIKDIKEYDSLFNSGILEGTVFGDIEVMIENSVDMAYAEKCAEHLLSLSEDMIDRICERTSAYHRYMLEEWDEDFVEEINEKVPCDASGRDMLNYIQQPTLFILPPQGEGTGYTVEGQCEWEPEHGIDIIILDDDLRYVGSAEGFEPWDDDDELECEY